MRALPAFLLFLLVVPGPVFAEESSFATGEVIETVACAKEPEKSYALYLPTSYTAESSWPVILFFDPGGNGASPVQLYDEVAEKHGYVLAGSNDARNYMDWDHQLQSARAMWQDVTARFSIDRDRIYTSGFSGGARAAIQVALVTKSVPAVLAVGAGFPSRDAVNENLPFVLVSATGRTDMNWLELETTHRELDELGLVNRRLVFDGGHEWAPAETFETMLGWVELQAVRSGAKTMEEDKVAAFLERERLEAELLESRGEVVAAYEAYARIVRDFDGLAEVGEVRANVARLEKSPELKRGRRDADRLVQDERATLQDYFSRLARAGSAVGNEDSRRADLRWWRREVEQLDGRREKAGSDAWHDMVERLHELVWRDAFERSVHASKEGNHALAVHYLQIADIASPGDPWVLYYLARAHARAGGLKQATDTLELAVAAGFDDVESLQTDPALEPLRDSERFQRIVARVGG